MNFPARFFQPLSRPKRVEFADDGRTELHRKEIDAFLNKVLSEEERDTIDTAFISDEATIFDCSMDMPVTWIANCRAAYNLNITDRLHMPLWQLVSWVGEQDGDEQTTN